MQQQVDGNLGDEIARTLKANQLGTSQSVYRQKVGFIQFLRRLNLALNILGIVVLVLFIVILFKNWSLSLTIQQGYPYNLYEILHRQEVQQKVTSTYYFVFPSFFLSMILWLLGLFYMRSEITRAKSACVVVCENGLLLVERQVRNNLFKAAYWNDIQAISGMGIVFKEYSIKCSNGKVLILRGSFQNSDELVELI